MFLRLLDLSIVARCSFFPDHYTVVCFEVLWGSPALPLYPFFPKILKPDSLKSFTSVALLQSDVDMEDMIIAQLCIPPLLCPV